MFTPAPRLGMGTTAGSWAFADAVAQGNSALVQKLLDSGLIILGKTNMTASTTEEAPGETHRLTEGQEFCGMKMTAQMPGWSALGGQTISPYVGRIQDDEKLLGHSVRTPSFTPAFLSFFWRVYTAC